MMKAKILGALLLSATFLMPVQAVYAAEAGQTWQQGGLSTNNVSDSTAKKQKTLGIALATYGLLMNSFATVASFVPMTMPLLTCNCTAEPVLCDIICVVFPFGGSTSFGINFDPLGIALDAILLNDAMTKEAKWSEDIPELQTAVRQIGEQEDFWDECEEGEKEDNFCNSVNAVLDETEVHISTLQNVGLEAIEDVAGKVLKTPEELLTAAPYIQEGFGTEHLSADGSTTAGGTTTGSSSSVIYWKDYFGDTKTGGTTTAGGSNTSGTTTTQSTVTEEDRKAWGKRKLAHLQFMGTAGVARADVGATVAASEQDNFSRLSSYVGSGKGLIAQIKVLCGLDLTLAQRLNALNMLYGQQAANEAASALQLVEEK